MKIPVPEVEQDVIFPLPDRGHPCRMLELGNKKNSIGVWKTYFERQKVEHTSIDWNGLDGALPRDLRELIPEFVPGGERHQYFDIVTNMGTTEHVNPQGQVWQNILNALAVGGILASSTPLPGDWTWHGVWYPDREWWAKFAEANHLEIQKIFVGWKAPRRLVIVRAAKTAHVELVHVPEIFRNTG